MWWSDFIHKPEAVAALLAATIAAIVSIWNFFASRRMETSLDSFRDKLERNRTYDVFQRERLSSHIDKVLKAFNEMYGLGDSIILKAWIAAGESLQAEKQFRNAWRRLDTHRAALRAFGVMSETNDREFVRILGETSTAWNDALGELARKIPANLPPAQRGFSEKEYFDYWQKLMDKLCLLRDLVAKVAAEISLPR